MVVQRTVRVYVFLTIMCICVYDGYTVNRVIVCVALYAFALYDMGMGVAPSDLYGITWCGTIVCVHKYDIMEVWLCLYMYAWFAWV